MLKVEVLSQNGWSSLLNCCLESRLREGCAPPPPPHSHLLSHSWESWESGLWAPGLVMSDRSMAGFPEYFLLWCPPQPDQSFPFGLVA